MRPILISFVLPLSLLSAFSCQTVMAQHEKTVISSWSFEEVTDSQTKDGVSELRDQVYGKYSMVRDVEGNALRIDGFRTYICRDNDAPQISGAFKAEAWMALGVYPWYWGPLVEFRNSESEGYMLGVNHTGHLGMRLSAGDGWVSNISISNCLWKPERILQCNDHEFTDRTVTRIMLQGLGRSLHR